MALYGYKWPPGIVGGLGGSLMASRGCGLPWGKAGGLSYHMQSICSEGHFFPYRYLALEMILPWAFIMYKIVKMCFFLAAIVFVVFVLVFNNTFLFTGVVCGRK
jgi:hypothetical protein